MLWIDLTLSAGADIPLLVEGEGQEGEVIHVLRVLLLYRFLAALGMISSLLSC